jgi:hypothetical protein
VPANEVSRARHASGQQTVEERCVIAHLGNTESDSESGESRSQVWGAARSYAIITSCIYCLFQVNNPDKSIRPRNLGDKATTGKSTNQSEGSVQIAELLLFSSECHDLISFISTSRKGFGFVFKKILHINSTAAYFIQRFRVGYSA